MSKEETKKVEVLHSNLVETLVVKKEEVMGVEESLKTTADALKKQLKDEAHARTVLQVRKVIMTGYVWLVKNKSLAGTSRGFRAYNNIPSCPAM